MGAPHMVLALLAFIILAGCVRDPDESVQTVERTSWIAGVLESDLSELEADGWTLDELGPGHGKLSGSGLPNEVDSLHVVWDATVPRPLVAVRVQFTSRRDATELASLVGLSEATLRQEPFPIATITEAQGLPNDWVAVVGMEEISFYPKRVYRLTIEDATPPDAMVPIDFPSLAKSTFTEIKAIAGAPEAIVLANEDIAFQFKLLNGPRLFARFDAATLKNGGDARVEFLQLDTMNGDAEPIATLRDVGLGTATVGELVEDSEGRAYHVEDHGLFAERERETGRHLVLVGEGSVWAFLDP